MDDYDEMKRKYTLNSNKNHIIQIGLRMGNIPDDIKIFNINKTTHDIGRIIVERGNVVCNKIRLGEGIIRIVKKDYEFDTFEILNSLDRHIIQVQIPLFLYVKKEEINRELEFIVNEYQLTAKIMVTHDVVICLCGKLDDALEGKIKMLMLIERLIKKDAIYYQGYLSSEFLIKNKVRVFFVSKINRNDVILSGRKNLLKDLETFLLPKRELIEQVCLVDTVKMIYSFYYLRTKIENILAEHDCYLHNEPIDNIFTRLYIKGYHIINTRKCLKKIKDLFQDIVKITYNEEDLVSSSYELFSFEMNREWCVDRKFGYKFLSVGLRTEVKNFIQKSNFRYEIEIDIDPELEDFLCGKKNGKINKICKDNDCDVTICSKIQDNEKKMVVYISGKGHNLYQTIIMLENEYPAELTFYLNEKHHRRIIGYGGKNIQKIMKKHGVYIKFMSDDEKFYSGYTGNVIIKTPKRNHDSLYKMKEEVLFLADEHNNETENFVHQLDYYTFYEYFFDNFTMFYNYIEINKDLNSGIKIYKINELDISDFEMDKENAIIYIENTCLVFMYSYGNCNFELVLISKWLDEEPSLSLKLFDSVLLYTYEPTFKSTVKIDEYKVDFTEKVAKPPLMNDDYVVGNRRKDGDKQSK